MKIPGFNAEAAVGRRNAHLMGAAGDCSGRPREVTVRDVCGNPTQGRIWPEWGCDPERAGS